MLGQFSEFARFDGLDRFGFGRGQSHDHGRATTGRGVDGDRSAAQREQRAGVAHQAFTKPLVAARSVIGYARYSADRQESVP